MWPGTPRTGMRRVSSSITSCAVMLRLHSRVGHSRVYSSTIGSHFKERPFVPVEDEVKRPDVVPPLRAVAMTGVLACTQAPFLVLNARHPVAFALPEAVDALGGGAEALAPEDIADAAVAVAGVLTDEHLHAGEEPGLIVGQAGLIAERGAAHGDDAGRPALGTREGWPCLLYTSPSP